MYRYYIRYNTVWCTCTNKNDFPSALAVADLVSSSSQRIKSMTFTTRWSASRSPARRPPRRKWCERWSCTPSSTTRTLSDITARGWRHHHQVLLLNIHWQMFLFYLYYLITLQDAGTNSRITAQWRFFGLFEIRCLPVVAIKHNCDFASLIFTVIKYR
jgi:hypothetical protein